jgi:hypothetical protein
VSGYSEDWVLINLKSNFDLWDTARCWWDASHIEFTKLVVVLNECSFTFVHWNCYSWLLVLVSSEGLGLWARDNSSAGNDLGHDTSNCFNTKSEGCNINENKALSFFGRLTT